MATPKEVSVSISRPSSGGESEVMVVRVVDTSSRLPVVEFDMPLDEFMRCLTGLAEVKAAVKRFPTEKQRQRHGLRCITKSMTCQRSFDKGKQRELVREHFATLDAEWEMFSDGTGTQQRGDQHAYIVRRWVDE